jgi:hypothetical protein
MRASQSASFLSLLVKISMFLGLASIAVSVIGIMIASYMYWRRRHSRGISDVTLPAERRPSGDPAGARSEPPKDTRMALRPISRGPDLGTTALRSVPDRRG